MSFSMPVGNQQQNSGSGYQSQISPEERNAWNQYQFDCFNAKVKELANGKKRKEKTLIGKVNFIMHLGTPPAFPSKWETKCALPQEGEEYSQEELAWKQQNPSHDFVWDMEWNDVTKKRERVRKQTSPSYPQNEFGVAVDFPQVMVDFSKHPSSKNEQPDLRPLRVSLNGSFHSDYFKTITFDGGFKPVSDKNLIYKICSAAGKEKQLIESGFDIGVAAESICNFTVRMDLSENKETGRLYLNVTASKPSAVEDLDVAGVELSAEQQIDSVIKNAPLSPFVGILLNGQTYTDEMLGMLGKDTYGFVKRASTSKTFTISGVSKKNGEPYSFEKGVDYIGSDFQKAWDKFSGSNTSNNAPQASQQGLSNKQDVDAGTSNTPREEAPAANKEAIIPQAPVYNEPPFDFDDDNL